jgi:ectoine hydroxylase-related dioxygenase (phytanoyl-CoA dioxygenase family)
MGTRSTARISDHVAACKRDGFARIPGVFRRNEVDRIRAEAVIACRGGNIEIRDGFPCLLFWPQSTYMQELARDRRLLDIVSAYYGHDDYELETQQYYFHLPGDPDEFAWHTDERFRPGVGNLYLQTAILVDDWTADNGAVEFIPGSHRQPFLNSGDLRVFIRGNRRGVRLLAQAGDVLTWSNTVVHGSERNTARQARGYFMNGFRARSLADC